MPVIHISSSKARYPVYIGDGALSRLPSVWRQQHGKIFIVTSPRIWRLWKKHLSTVLESSGKSVQVLTVPPGEKYKNLSTISRLAEQLAAARAARDSLLIAFGGGVIGDVTGFLAATFMRGIDYIQVPTTLLAQVDSSVGGKTGVNLRAGKNLIGSFYPPSAVIVDPHLLQTLPPRELRAGLYESIKAGILGDKQLFAMLERHGDLILARDSALLVKIISASIRVKAKIVVEDERERGARMMLNLGHTLGHAIEAATQYKQLLHGEAVAWGIRAATWISRTRGLLSETDASRIDRIILTYGPPRRFVASDRNIIRLTYVDKKASASQRRFILPVSIGKTIVSTDVSDAEMLAALQRVRAL